MTPRDVDEFVDAPEVTPSPGEDYGELSIAEEELAIRERLRVDPNCLDEDLSRCSSDLAYVGARMARATLVHGRAKIGSKKIRAIAYMRAKEAALDTYGSSRGGATADVINAMVDQDEEYLAAADHEVIAEAVLVLTKTNVEAAKARRDMLVQVGAARRAEMERDGYIVSRRKDTDE